MSIHDEIARLATIRIHPEQAGITREVYTREYTTATEYVSDLMRGAGLEPRLDAFGNLWGRWPGREETAPRVLTGSHYDTTLNAGRYDGVVGVLGGIEAVRLLRAAGFEPRRTIEVIGFAGEEPRFGAGCIGSRAMTGTIARAELDTMRDRDGVSIADAQREFGLDPDRLADAILDPATVHAFVELHIEQGGLLEAEGLPIGAVERIAAPHDLRVTLTGSATHSGATPMHLRRDALVGAAEFVAALERIAIASPSGTTVGTVGVLQVSPGAVNIVPGAALMDIDIRDSDKPAREDTVAKAKAELERIAAARGLGLEIATTVADEPVACAPVVIDAVRHAADALQLPYRAMTSGAYHDAMVLGRQVPIGMIFVPSKGGVSHHPDEYTAPEEIDRGVEVLAGTLRRLAG